MNENIEIQNFLEQIISCSKLHSRWLNTLSFLEYMGTRKMAKALLQEDFTETLLGHLNEEARHSLYFKKLANRVSSKNLGFQREELLAGEEARAYFQKLDIKSKTLAGGHTILNYLLTTWVIEQRAVLVYTVYNQLLAQKKYPFSLNPLLKDEINHLAHVKNSMEKLNFNYKKALSVLQNFEKKEFELLIKYMNQEIEKGKTELQL